MWKIDTAFAVSVLGICFSWMYWRARKKSKRRLGSPGNQGMSRRMSFSSASIAGGAFPPNADVKESVINVLVSFEDIDNCPTEEDIVPIVEKLIAEVDRMAGIPKQFGRGNADWHFERCPKIDPKQMIRTFDVHHDTIDAVANEVQKIIGNCRIGSNDRNLPYWEFCLIRNSGKSESMLVWRVHHCIGDGISLGMVASRIISGVDGSPAADMIPPSMRLSKKMERKGSFGRKLLDAVSAAVEIAISPYQPLDHGTAFIKNTVGIRKDTHHRKVILFDQYPMAYIKAIKNKADASINEILHAALGKAIRDLCLHFDCPVIEKHGEKTRCRAGMTVGFPRDPDADINDACHNGWVLLAMDVGVGFKSNRDRLRHIKERSQQLRDRPLAPYQLVLQNIVLPKLPLFLSRKIVHDVFGGLSFSSSNVPGPAHAISFANKTVSACRFLVCNIHPFISICSYNGYVNIALTADDEATPGVHLLPKFYTRALVELGEEFGVEIPPSLRAAST